MRQLFSCMKLPISATVSLLWKDVVIHQNARAMRALYQLFILRPCNLNFSRNACESWSPGQGGRLSSSCCCNLKVTWGCAAPVLLQLIVSVWVNRLFISNCWCALHSYWWVRVIFKFDRTMVVGNSDLWVSATPVLDIVPLLHRGAHFLVLAGCDSDTACKELLSFKKFLNSASVVQLPLIHYQ